MEDLSYQMLDGKLVIRIRDRMCDNAEELLSSQLFYRILERCIRDLEKRNSRLLGIFDHMNITDADIALLIETFKFLTHLPANLVPRVVEGSDQFFADKILFNDFVEYVYNYWRSLQRLIVCDSEGGRFDKRPYHTFNNTIEHLTHLVRGSYRDIQENITGEHPRIFRQVRAGAEVAAIALPGRAIYPSKYAEKLDRVSVIRQILIYPPLIFNSPTNKRTGTFERIYQNPLDKINLKAEDWLCYPAKVGELLVMVYFPVTLFEMDMALCNLFEMADDIDLQRKPDAVYLFGVPKSTLPAERKTDTVFYEDDENDILVGAIPDEPQFGYFGYLKKMILTLHNIKMMKMGRLPFHGAMFNIVIKNSGSYTFLIMGDTGAGKSETLEAMRQLGSDDLEDITIIADDMGSLNLNANKEVLGYGTETGAFVRLDDLQPGYAFGQLDRTIMMNPNQVNARVVIPATTFNNVIKGFKIDYVLYANNYNEVNDQHPVFERFSTPEEALEVFRAGKVMSKGTTQTTGLVQTYFANIFGPDQYQELHEGLAKEYFQAFFDNHIYVGQIRTQLGISGKEQTGPQFAAQQMLAMLKKK